MAGWDRTIYTSDYVRGRRREGAATAQRVRSRATQLCDAWGPGYVVVDVSFVGLEGEGVECVRDGKAASLRTKRGNGEVGTLAKVLGTYENKSRRLRNSYF